MFLAKILKSKPNPTLFTTPKQTNKKKKTKPKKERARKSSSEFSADFNKKNIRDETNMKAEIFT